MWGVLLTRLYVCKHHNANVYLLVSPRANVYLPVSPRADGAQHSIVTCSIQPLEEEGPGFPISLSEAETTRDDGLFTFHGRTSGRVGERESTCVGVRVVLCHGHLRWPSAGMLYHVMLCYERMRWSDAFVLEEYAVLKAIDLLVDKPELGINEKLICVSNPHGKHEWRGDYSGTQNAYARPIPTELQTRTPETSITLTTPIETRTPETMAQPSRLQ